MRLFSLARRSSFNIGFQALRNLEVILCPYSPSCSWPQRVPKDIRTMIEYSLVPAMIYVDPASTGTLMRVLAPAFILASALGIHFKHVISDLVHRVFKRNE